MERLTVWNDKTEGAELISWDEEEWKDFMGSLDVPICTELSLAVDKLAEYEDLEEKLEKTYGKCDGLLETAINYLVRHEGAEIGTPAKARLLTDEDVDEWESYKAAKEQGLLLRLPCKVGDTVWKISRFLIGSECGDLPDVWYRIDQDNFTLSMLGYYGKTIFLTKEEAEQALAKMK